MIASYKADKLAEIAEKLAGMESCLPRMVMAAAIGSRKRVDIFMKSGNVFAGCEILTLSEKEHAVVLCGGNFIPVPITCIETVGINK